MAAVLHLTFGTAMAADNTEVQHAEPTAVNAPENQSTPREEATQDSSQSNTPATQEEPAKTQPANTQQEPDCN
jgi:hypothetical protein